MNAVFASLSTPNLLRIFLKHQPLLVKARYADGTTLLHQAVFRNSLECVEMLLSYNADANAQDIVGRTPLAHVLDWEIATHPASLDERALLKPALGSFENRSDWDIHERV